jgi:hypothetical protein
MGVDCRLVTEKGSNWVGRLYHYTDHIEEGQIYKTKDLTTIIGEAIEQGDTFYGFAEVLEIAAKTERAAIVSEDNEAWGGIDRIAYREPKTPIKGEM